MRLLILFCLLLAFPVSYADSAPTAVSDVDTAELAVDTPALLVVVQAEPVSETEIDTTGEVHLLDDYMALQEYATFRCAGIRWRWRPN